MATPEQNAVAGTQAKSKPFDAGELGTFIARSMVGGVPEVVGKYGHDVSGNGFLKELPSALGQGFSQEVGQPTQEFVTNPAKDFYHGVLQKYGSDLFGSPPSATSEPKPVDLKKKSEQAQKQADLSAQGIQNAIGEALGPLNETIKQEPSQFESEMSQIMGADNLKNNPYNKYTAAMMSDVLPVDQAIKNMNTGLATSEKNIPYADVISTMLTQKKNELLGYGTANFAISTSSWPKQLQDIYSYLEQGQSANPFGGTSGPSLGALANAANAGTTPNTGSAGNAANPASG